jgi:hypothetical protein
VPLEFAEGAISFNPPPTARNLNKPARMLRLGLKGRRKLYRNKTLWIDCPQIRWLTHTGREVPPSGLKPSTDGSPQTNPEIGSSPSLR